MISVSKISVVGQNENDIVLAQQIAKKIIGEICYENLQLKYIINPSNSEMVLFLRTYNHKKMWHFLTQSWDLPQYYGHISSSEIAFSPWVYFELDTHKGRSEYRISQGIVMKKLVDWYKSILI